MSHINTGSEPKRQGARIRKCLMVAVLAFAVMGIAACAPQQTTSDSSSTSSAKGETQTAAMEGPFEFSADADCTVCHSQESDSLSDSSCTASLHAQLSCTDCHSDIDAVAAAHDGVQYGDKTAKRLKSTSVDESNCLKSGCHDSWEALAEKTANSTVLTDSNGTTVNPHAMPQNDSHDTVSCENCHVMHDSTTVQESAPKACIGCHHTGVYECYTCHD